MADLEVSPELVYLLLQDCELAQLMRMEQFCSKPNFCIRGKVESMSAMLDLLQDQSPLELMVTIAETPCEFLLLGRWPSQGDDGSVNIRWKDLDALAEEIDESTAMLGRLIVRQWRSESPSEREGHRVLSFGSEPLKVASGITMAVSRAIEIVAGEVGQKGKTFASWSGALTTIRSLHEGGVILADPGLPGYLGYGPVGVPEENVKRANLESLCAIADRKFAGGFQVWFSGLRVRGEDELDFALGVRRKKMVAELLLESEDRAPGSMIARIRAAAED